MADRNSPQEHVSRAVIVLATAEGCGTAGIMRRAGVPKPCVWRWQARFMAAGVAGLLRDKTGPPGTPPLPVASVELTLGEPPGETTHWTGRVMANIVAISLSAVQGIWKAHGLVPVEAAVPAGKLVHAVLDTASAKPISGTHKHPKVRAWMARHPFCTFHVVPTSCFPPASPDAGRCADGSIRHYGANSPSRSAGA